MLSCYIVIRDAGYHLYSCKIYWFKLFKYCLYILLVLPIVPVAYKLAVGNFKKKNRWNFLKIPESTHFLHLRRRYHFRSGDHLHSTIGGSFLVLGSFAIQFGDHLRARDTRHQVDMFLCLNAGVSSFDNY